MPRRPTIAELQSRIKSLEPFQEAFFCRDDIPITVRSGELDVTVIGLDRASGGVVVSFNGTFSFCEFVCNFCQRIEAQGNADPYARDLANQLRKLQKAAIQKRTG